MKKHDTALPALENITGPHLNLERLASPIFGNEMQFFPAVAGVDHTGPLAGGSVGQRLRLFGFKFCDFGQKRFRGDIRNLRFGWRGLAR